MKKKKVKSLKPSKIAPQSTLSKQFDVNRLNQVTSFSKILAAVLFIALPFLAFFLGLMYQSSYGILR